MNTLLTVNEIREFVYAAADFEWANRNFFADKGLDYGIKALGWKVVGAANRVYETMLPYDPENSKECNAADMQKAADALDEAVKAFNEATSNYDVIRAIIAEDKEADKLLWSNEYD
jgi:hypothetical protein